MTSNQGDSPTTGEARTRSVSADKATGRWALDERVAMVTGACGKLGPIWVRALLETGARVAALDLASAEASGPYSELAAHYPDQLQRFDVDVTSRDSLTEARDAVEERFGPVSVVVNNAGIDQPPGAPSQSFTVEDIPEDVCRQVLEVNLIGLFLTTQVFLPSIKRAGGGSIINIGSIYGHVSPDVRLYSHIDVDPPFLKPPMYGASKAGVDSLTRYLSTHLAADGIRVNSLVPGGVLGGQDDEFKRKFCDRVPLQRMATADDLVGPLLFLASDASSYVTGQSLLVDGGLSVW